MNLYNVTLTVNTQQPAEVADILNLETVDLPFHLHAEPANSTSITIEATMVEAAGLAAPLEAIRKTQAAISPILRRTATKHTMDRGLLWQDIVAANVATAS